ncbi:MAG: FG-GAP repeat protein [Myxococcota bacterium]
MTLVLALIAGCVSECSGPACEDAWPASRLIVARAAELDGSGGILALPDRVQGSLVEGARWSVLGWKDRILVGMPDRSAVALLDPPVGTQTTDTLRVAQVEQPLTERFGASIALADTDGDGRTELWVGAPGYDGSRGALYRYPDVDALDTEPWDLRLTGFTSEDAFGTHVRGCADVTGDALDDLVVTAPSFEEPVDGTWEPTPDGIPRLAGALWLLPSDTITTRPEVTYPWELAPTWWGAAVGDGAGGSTVCDRDLTGDGLADLAIGAPFAGSDDAGRVFVVSAAEGLPARGPLVDVLPWTLVPDDTSAGWFGSALATREDADGIELVVGSAGWNRGRGSVTLFRGPLPTFPGLAKPDARFERSRDLPDHFGNAVATGDLDGDGESDLLVGAPQYRELRGAGEARTRYDAGHAWIWTSPGRFRWTTDDLVIPTDHEVRGSQPFLRIGRGAVFHDLDGDGSDELLQPVRAPEPDGR